MPYYVGESVFIHCPLCVQFDEITQNMTEEDKTYFYFEWIGWDYETYLNDDGDEVIKITGRSQPLRDYFKEV
jgi:hypothetical protein